MSQSQNMTSNKKKRICFVLTASPHFGRSRLILEELHKNPDVDLLVVPGGAVLPPSKILSVLDSLGIAYTKPVPFEKSDTPFEMARISGDIAKAFAEVFKEYEPDMVVVRGDRFEILPIAMAAAYMNIPIAHIEGGDVTGTIDESVRHATTKLAHLHFVTNAQAHDRLVRMGESKDAIYNVGAPEVEVISHVDDSAPLPVAIEKPFLLVLNHPVTTEYGSNKEHTEALLAAVAAADMTAIWLMPNADAGAAEIREAIEEFKGKTPSKIQFMEYLPAEEFNVLLVQTACLIGNSSAGFKETSYVGVPVVNVGSRQQGRWRGENVLTVESFDTEAILEAIKHQVRAGRYPQNLMYYKADTSKNIAEILAKTNPSVQKRFID